MFFEESVQDLQGLIEGLLRSLGVHPSDLSDLTQQVLMNMYSTYGNGKITCKKRLRAIARTTARNALYKHWKQRQRLEEGKRQYIDYLSTQKRCQAECSSKTIEFETLIGKFEKRASPDTVRAVRLWLAGKTYAQIAQLLDCERSKGRKAVFSFVRFVKRRIG